MAIPALTSDKPCAEIMRQRDPATGMSTWSIDAIMTDPHDGSSQRVKLVEASSMRGILDAALDLEKRGYHVARGGLAR